MDKRRFPSFYINVLGKKIDLEIAKKNKTRKVRPFTMCFEYSKDDLCKCGHTRKNHKYIESCNYTEGKCLIKGCECNCLGGWFHFKEKK